MKKYLCGALSLLLLAGSLAGCAEPGDSPAASGDGSAGSSVSAGSSGDSTAPLSFSVMTVNFGEEPTGKVMQEAWLEKSAELMGRELDIDFTYVAMADYGEKLKIMLASQDIADVTTSWGLEQKDIFSYGESGMFVELTEKMDLLPNYQKRLEDAPSSRDALYSSSGKLYGFYTVQTGWQEYSGGSNELCFGTAFRKDIFDEHNIPLPETVEELYTAAKQLKEIYPDKYPIFQVEEWSPAITMLLYANHIGGYYASGGFSGMFYDGESYQYAPILEGYKEALQEMNRWYTEGLISPDYFTHTQANGTATLAAGDGMIVPNAWYGYPGAWATQYPDQEWVLKVGLSNPAYGKAWSYNMGYADDTFLRSNWAALVSSKAENVDEILTFMDLQISDEMNDLLSWGVEGVTYNVVDGEKHLADDLADKMQEYAYGTGNCRAGIFPQIINQASQLDLQVQQGFLRDGEVEVNTVPGYIRENFSPDECTPESKVKGQQLSAEDSEWYANAMTPINTYAAEQMALFISNSRSFDEWDAYVEEIKSMGDLDKAIELMNSTVLGEKDY